MAEVTARPDAERAASRPGRPPGEEERPEPVQEHVAEDRFESFGLPFQERLRDGFLSLAGEFPDRFRIIDGNRPEAEVAADVTRAALARMEMT
jgi:thymidylate kinase